MAPQGGCPVNGAKRSFDTAWEDNSLLALRLPLNCSHIDKRPRTPDVRSVSEDASMVGTSSEFLPITWPSEPTGIDHDVYAPDLMHFSNATNNWSDVVGQCDFYMDFEEVPMNNSVYHDTRFLVTDVNSVPAPSIGISPMFEAQNPDDGPVLTFAEITNPKETGLVQLHGQNNSTITDYEAPTPEFDTCFGTVCTFPSCTLCGFLF